MDKKHDHGMRKCNPAGPMYSVLARAAGLLLLSALLAPHQLRGQQESGVDGPNPVLAVAARAPGAFDQGRFAGAPPPLGPLPAAPHLSADRPNGWVIVGALVIGGALAGAYVGSLMNRVFGAETSVLEYAAVSGAAAGGAGVLYCLAVGCEWCSPFPAPRHTPRWGRYPAPAVNLRIASW